MPDSCHHVCPGLFHHCRPSLNTWLSLLLLLLLLLPQHQHQTTEPVSGCQPANIAAPKSLEGGGKRSSTNTGSALEEYELVDLGKPQQENESRLREARREVKRAEKIARLDAEDEMKFSHSIQFNAVPDWSSHYIAYSNLKKL